MQRTLVLRLPFIRGLHLEQVDRLVARLASARHDPLAVHLGALERPQGAEDRRLTVRASAERVRALAKELGVTMEDIMGEPLQDVPEASPEDVAFFREYAGMSDEEKDRYRQALQIMFPDKGKGGD